MAIHYGLRPEFSNQNPRIAFTQEEWERSENWLEMPAVSNTDVVFYGLQAVFDNNNNFATFRATGNYTIDWGDGSPPENYSSNDTAFHIYDYDDLPSSTETNRGYRQALVTVVPQSGSTLTNINLSIKHDRAGLVNGHSSNWLDIRFAMNNTGTLTLYNANWLHRMLERIDWVGGNSQTSFANLFRECSSLLTLENFTNNPGAGTSFSATFLGCQRLLKCPPLDTSNSTRFDSMFSGCTDLVTIPPLDTRKATNFLSMFSTCNSLRYIPDSHGLFDTSLGTSFASMFFGCSDLKTMPFVDTSRNTGSLASMFDGCNSLIRIRISPGTRTSSLSRTFRNCLNAIYLPPLDTSNCTSFRESFTNMRSLRRFSQTHLDTTRGRDFRLLFSGCSSLEVLPQFEITDELTTLTLASLFAGCAQIRTASNFLQTNKATDFASMFSGCSSLRRLSDLGNFSENVISFSSMFAGCNTLEEAPQMNTSSGVSFASMFSGCSSLDFCPDYDTSQGTNFSSMFNNCRSLQVAPNLSNTSLGTTFASMFNECTNLINAPSTLSTPLTTNLGRMFYLCRSLQKCHPISADLVTSTSTSTTAAINETFLGCSSLASAVLINARRNTSFAGCAMGKDELVDLFNGLADISNEDTRTINISGNYGASELSQADRDIALNKNWNITG